MRGGVDHDDTTVEDDKKREPRIDADERKWFFI